MNKSQQTTKFNRQEELQVAPAAVFLQYIILLHLCTKSSVDENDAKFKQSACREEKRRICFACFFTQLSHATNRTYYLYVQ